METRGIITIEEKTVVLPDAEVWMTTGEIAGLFYVRGVSVRDCTASRLLVHAVPYNDDGEAAPRQPVFSHLSFERLTLTGRGLRDGSFENVEPIELAGFDAPGHELRDVVLDGITVENETGTMTLPVQYCRGLTIRDLTCVARK